LIGAGLVLYELVDQDKSNARLVSITLHLVNTFLLLGALTLFTRSLKSPERVNLWSAITKTQKLWLVSGALLLATGTTGAIAALGNTLYPAESLAHGLQQDFHPESHLALRVRILHPIFAVASALLIFALGARRISSSTRPTPVRLLIAATAGNVALGLLNLLLLAPVWMQLVHLLVADLVWIAWIWSFAELKAEE
jgi:heme A synthase